MLGHGSPFLLFVPAVMLSAWYGGLWPGVVATVLSAAVGAQFLPPSAVALEEWDRVALFLVVGVAVTWLQVMVAMANRRISALLAREQAARAEAEAANKAKDEFLAAVSHELRGPLSVIGGWASMLTDRVLDPTSVRKAADVIERNARLQERLVEDIIDSVRASRGTMRLERQRVDVASLVAAAVDAARPTAKARGIDLWATIPPGESSVWGDPARLHQVLMNLLTNALKFTPSGGSVDVRVQRSSHTSRITMSDTGVGIAPDLLPHVFDPFIKGTDSRQGLGLGLAIVRHLVEMHGGTVEATSPGREKGSVFTLTLPLAASASDSAATSAPPSQGSSRCTVLPDLATKAPPATRPSRR
jgi:signal transduction histidine kinase